MYPKKAWSAPGLRRLNLTAEFDPSGDLSYAEWEALKALHDLSQELRPPAVLRRER